jgi:hypothetical protein
MDAKQREQRRMEAIKRFVKTEFPRIEKSEAMRHDPDLRG